MQVHDNALTVKYNNYVAFFLCTKIIEEARRVLMIESNGDRNQFKNACLDRLVEEVETIIYYGIHSKGICAPKSPKLSKFFYANRF